MGMGRRHGRARRDCSGRDGARGVEHADGRVGAGGVCRASGSCPTSHRVPDLGHDDSARIERCSTSRANGRRPTDIAANSTSTTTARAAALPGRVAQRRRAGSSSLNLQGGAYLRKRENSYVLLDSPLVRYLLLRPPFADRIFARLDEIGHDRRAFAFAPVFRADYDRTVPRPCAGHQ